MTIDPLDESALRFFSSCKTVDDILATAKAIGIELSDSDVVAIVMAL